MSNSAVVAVLIQIGDVGGQTIFGEFSAQNEVSDNSRFVQTF